MLRGRGFVLLQRRSVYIPPGVAHSFTKPPKGSLSPPEMASIRASKQEAALLDRQLLDLKQKQMELRQKLNQAKDRDLQAAVVRKEGISIENSANSREIDELDALMQAPKQLSESPRQKDLVSVLPPSIKALLPNRSEPKTLQLFKSTTWPQIIESLPQLPQSTPVQDVEEFLSAIPLHQRSLSVAILEKIVPDSLRSPLVNDLFMAAYAEQRNPEKVEALLNACEKPSVYSYGHLAKALFRTRSSPDRILGILKRMTQESGLDPSLPVLSTAVQSLIQHGRHTEAESLFDNMKYWSVQSQPDLKLYNSMILCAAKQHNVNRALDLLQEMQSRRPFPLAPNAETYNYVIYACSRNPETHLMAWDMFLEAQNHGFEPDRRSFQALLYLCAQSGELVLARALFRSLAAKSLNLIDDFVLNALMVSYRSWKPGPSPISASDTGRSIRATIMMNDGFKEIGGSDSGLQVPFLPTSQLDRNLILLESSAIMEFFAEHHPASLVVRNVASLSTHPVLHNFLKVAIVLGNDAEEFKRRYNRFTEMNFKVKGRILEAPEETALVSKNQFVVPRDQHIYRLAIQAAAKFRDLEFGREIWTERGAWRREPEFQSLDADLRNKYDFQFARDLVELLAVCGRVEEAVLLAKSAAKLKPWRKHHLKTLMDICREMEDHASLRQIAKLLRGSL